MEIKSTEEARSGVKEYSKRFGNLLVEKKGKDLDIKALKQEAKENGIAIGVLTKCFNKLKAKRKQTEAERFEEETVMDWLESDQDILDLIDELNEK